MKVVYSLAERGEGGGKRNSSQQIGVTVAD